MPSESVPSPVSSRALIPFPWIVFVCFFAVCLPLPVLSLHVHEGMGFSLVTAGWAIGAQALATVLTRPWAGRLIDRKGPKGVALMGLPLVALSGLFYLASSYASDPGVALGAVILGRLVMGPAESLCLVAVMAWGIARLGAGRTGLVMTWQGIAMFAALGLGAPAGLYLMQRFGFAGVAWGTVALSAVALLIVLPLAPSPPSGKVGDASFLGILGVIWRQGAVLACSAGPQALIGAFIALDYASHGWEGAGLTLTGVGAGVILVRAFFSHMPDKVGGRLVGLVSLLVEAAGLLLLWTAPNPLLAVAGATLAGAGFSLIFPAMGVEAVRRVPVTSRGLALGSFFAFFDAAVGLSGPLGGLVAGAMGYPAVFLAGAVVCLIGVGLLLQDRPQPA
jgi:MFS family permease